MKYLSEYRDPETARKWLEEACHKFLSNPVIEDFHLEIE